MFLHPLLYLPSNHIITSHHINHCLSIYFFHLIDLPATIVPNRHGLVALAASEALVFAVVVVVEDECVGGEALLKEGGGDLGVGLAETAAARVVVAVLVELGAVGVVDAQAPGGRGVREEEEDDGDEQRERKEGSSRRGEQKRGLG